MTVSKINQSNLLLRNMMTVAYHQLKKMSIENINDIEFDLEDTSMRGSPKKFR